MMTPIEQITNRQVGVVDTISPSVIEVNLDWEAPHSTSMGAGQPQPFPRLNGFLLIPCESSFIVGKIQWLSIEPSPFPRRKGIQDFGILDLPFPLRKLKLNILGILKAQNNRQETHERYQINYKFKRGIHLFPSLGDAVILPDSEQLRAIIESGTNGNIKIGTCPLADNADVKVSANRIFGRHLAVLGNTGSGKSCTIAGLIKWSLEEAKKEISDATNPNARFIILDPNGEYTKAFSSFNPLVFRVNSSDNKTQLKVPYWFWNFQEWASITQASGKTQRPLLSRALRKLKEDSNEDNPVWFDCDKLADYIDKLATDTKTKPQYIDSLTMRIRTIFSDDRMKKIICANPKTDIKDWLNGYLGKGSNQCVSIIDLSLVPKDIIYLVTAVIARIIFELLQGYKREYENSKTLPTVLVMEEAHTFIQKNEKDYDDLSSSGICRQIFEKIAREGRKFGLGLVLSSQRPAELSATVLSQCNTFLLHRITNDRDQEFISRLVPDSLKGMIQELPALSQRHAYLLGWASEIPILVEISELGDDSRPKSDDPDFWGAWTN